VYGVKRTTVYLPDEMKAQIEAIAREGRTEAEVIRRALSAALTKPSLHGPTLPLTEQTGPQTNWAERIDGVVDEGFGR